MQSHVQLGIRTYLLTYLLTYHYIFEQTAIYGTYLYRNRTVPYRTVP